MQNGVNENQIDQWTNLCLDNINIHDPRDEDGIPPFICHVFTKYDECLTEQRIQNAERLEEMHKRGAIGHYLFVSAKTEVGMDELRNAIFDCNIDIGPKFITPSQKMNPIANTKQTNKRTASKLKKLEQQKKAQILKRRQTSFVPSMAKTFTLGFGAKKDSGLAFENSRLDGKQQ